MTLLFNLTDKKKVRRRLRDTMKPAERILWERLRKKRCNGFRFRRQYGVGAFIVDFYCPSLSLAIEVDGSIHNEIAVGQYDRWRQEWIESVGIRVIRFTNDDVVHRIDSVIERIIAAAEGKPRRPVAN
jgi:very-short-patch-repair endonuclease